MLGLALLGYVIGYVLLALVTTYVVVKAAGKRGATKRRKIIAAASTLFVFWLIPFWDWLPTVVYHNYLCRTEAGVKIYRSVEGVEGFLSNTGDWPLKFGYQYIDARQRDGQVIRYRKNPNLSSAKYWLEEVPVEPSLYGFRYEQAMLKFNETKSQHIIYMISTGEVLATLTDFSVTTAFPYGGLYEIRKAFWPFCRPCLWAKENGVQLQKEIILETLKPLQAKS